MIIHCWNKSLLPDIIIY